MTDEAIRNGSTPMSVRRVIAPGAVLQCSVEKTRWPVMAAWNAISAVSVSRISPTSIMSGSCRKMALNCAANVSPALTFTADWFTPSSSYSIGSSQVIIFVSAELMWLRAEYRVVVFPLPVGPSDQYYAVRLCDEAFEGIPIGLGKADLVQ